jgi:hypothetical protein
MHQAGEIHQTIKGLQLSVVCSVHSSGQSVCYQFRAGFPRARDGDAGLVGAGYIGNKAGQQVDDKQGYAGRCQCSSFEYFRETSIDDVGDRAR